MRSRSLLLAPLILLVGIGSFEAGRRTGARTVTPDHAAAPSQAPAPVQALAPVHATTCDKELAETRTKLGICLTYHAPAETERPPELRALMEAGKAEVIVRLDKPITTEMIEPTDSIVVKRPDGTVHAYGPGEWPPPGGPGVGSKILRRRRSNGETEVSPLDGFPEPDGPVSLDSANISLPPRFSAAEGRRRKSTDSFRPGPGLPGPPTGGFQPEERPRGQNRAPIPAGSAGHVDDRRPHSSRSDCPRRSTTGPIRPAGTARRRSPGGDERG